MKKLDFAKPSEGHHDKKFPATVRSHGRVGFHALEKIIKNCSFQIQMKARSNSLKLFNHFYNFMCIMTTAKIKKDFPRVPIFRHTRSVYLNKS